MGYYNKWNIRGYLMLDNSLYNIPYISSQTDKIEEITEIYDDVGKLCGFFERDNEVQMSAYDNLGRFSGYFISNKHGNTVTFDSQGKFDGYVVQDENLLKYDKAGNYQGYYEISKDGNITEYESSGKYKGIYMGVNTSKITKYDELGRPVLFIVSK